MEPSSACPFVRRFRGRARTSCRIGKLPCPWCSLLLPALILVHLLGDLHPPSDKQAVLNVGIGILLEEVEDMAVLDVLIKHYR